MHRKGPRLKTSLTPRYKAVLLDLDDTLLDFQSCEQQSLQRCHQKYFHHVEDFAHFCQVFRQINLGLWRRVEAGMQTVSALGEDLFRSLTKEFGLSYCPSIEQHYADQLIEHSFWEPGAETLLNALYAQGVRLGFITNGFTKIQRAKFENLQLHRWSQVLVISEELGHAKPHREIFDHALLQLAACPEETLMVGDSLTSDGAGARNTGMPFCWYNPLHRPTPEDWMPHLIISRLEELHPLF